MIRSIVVLAASFLCLLAAVRCGRYIWHFLADPSNAYRHEYLSGAVLVGGASALVWGPLLFAAFYPASGLVKWQRIVGMAAGGLAVVGWAAPIVLSFAA